MAKSDTSARRRSAPASLPDTQPDAQPVNPDFNETEAAIARSMQGFFDPDWYVTKYPDVVAAGLDPLRHFIQFGVAERRDPNAFFSSAWPSALTVPN